MDIITNGTTKETSNTNVTDTNATSNLTVTTVNVNVNPTPNDTTSVNPTVTSTVTTVNVNVNSTPNDTTSVNPTVTSTVTTVNVNFNSTPVSYDSDSDKFEHIFRTDISYFTFERRLICEKKRKKKKKRSLESGNTIDLRQHPQYFENYSYLYRRGDRTQEEDMEGDFGFIRLGALTVLHMGNIVANSPFFHTRDVIFPCGFKAKRLFWSWIQSHHQKKVTERPNVINRSPGPEDETPYFGRCIYTSDVLDDGRGRPIFRIRAEDDPTRPIISYHPHGAFTELVRRINYSRIQVATATGQPSMLDGIVPSLRAEIFFGFLWPDISKKIEKQLKNSPHQLPNYRLRYDTNIKIPRNLYLAFLESMSVDSVGLNVPVPLGCSRTEPYRKITSEEKRKYLDAFTLNPANAHIPWKDENDSHLQDQSDYYSSIFDSSQTSQYRIMQMKNRSSMRLQVLRSSIQGWGVFAKQPIKKGEMIIEYVGELISSALEDKREEIYDAQDLGCYMFRIPDEEETIDATMKGNIARFINHSCNPNAKTDHIVIGTQKKIIIYAIKDINPGEEIAYNYMFAIDDEDKVPCTCGAYNCKGFMNV